MKLLNDSPIEGPKGDYLNRIDMAHRFAKHLMSYQDVKSLCVTIEGEWGVGKSSFVNLMFDDMGAVNTEQRPVSIIKFTPWVFASAKDMSTKLLTQMASELGRSRKRRHQIVAVSSYLLAITAIVSSNVGDSSPMDIFQHLSDQPLDSLFSSIEALPGASATLGVFESIKKRLISRDLEGIKSDISKLLLDNDELVIIIFDDFERLHPSQIQDIFKMSRIIADFPNTIYIYVMDKRVVIDALTPDYGDYAVEYLNKFSQLSFNIPKPDQMKLHNHFLKELDSTIREHELPDGEYQTKRFRQIWRYGLREFVRTPRDSVRILNGFRMVCSVSQADSCWADTLAIEMLRIYEPKLYNMLSDNPLAVINDTEEFTPSTKEKDALQRELWMELLDKASPERREIVTYVLHSLFPESPGAVAGYRGEEETYRHKLCCNINHFHNYFSLAMVNGNLSDTEVRDIFLQLCSASELNLIEGWAMKMSTSFYRFGQYVIRNKGKYSAEERSLFALKLMVAAQYLPVSRGTYIPTGAIYASFIGMRIIVDDLGQNTWSYLLQGTDEKGVWGVASAFSLRLQSGRQSKLPLPSIEERSQLADRIYHSLIQDNMFELEPDKVILCVDFFDKITENAPFRNLIHNTEAA